MPTYSFKNTKTGEVFDEMMPYADKEKYLKDNPHFEQQFDCGPSIGDPVRLGLTKNTNNFRDRLKEIKKAHRGSTIQTQNISNV